MGLRVEEDCLPRGMNGYYCDALGLIVLHDKLNARQRLCTLQHELIHARHRDIGCGSIAGLKAELRARRETALTLISPVEYQLAESAYDGRGVQHGGRARGHNAGAQGLPDAARAAHQIRRGDGQATTVRHTVSQSDHIGLRSHVGAD